MRRILILGGLILFCCTACQRSNVTAASDWPRISLEARLLILDQNFVDEFHPDPGFVAVEKFQHAPGKLSPLHVELILAATQSNERTMSLMAPRMTCREGLPATTSFKSLNPFTGGTHRFGAELSVTLRPKRLHVPQGVLQVDFDMQLVPYDASNSEKELAFSGPDYHFKAEPWPSFHGSFQTASGSTWLIPLPNKATRQAVTDPREKEEHLWLLIRPTLIHSAEHDDQLFPALPEDEHSAVFSPN